MGRKIATCGRELHDRCLGKSGVSAEIGICVKICEENSLFCKGIKIRSNIVVISHCPHKSSAEALGNYYKYIPARGVEECVNRSALARKKKGIINAVALRSGKETTHLREILRLFH